MSAGEFGIAVVWISPAQWQRLLGREDQPVLANALGLAGLLTEMKATEQVAAVGIDQVPHVEDLDEVTAVGFLQIHRRAAVPAY